MAEIHPVFGSVFGNGTCTMTYRRDGAVWRKKNITYGQYNTVRYSRIQYYRTLYGIYDSKNATSCTKAAVS